MGQTSMGRFHTLLLRLSQQLCVLPYYPMRGFGSFAAMARFCTAHDELHDHLRSREHLNETVSLADQRRLFQERWGEVCALLQAA